MNILSQVIDQHAEQPRLCRRPLVTSLEHAKQSPWGRSRNCPGMGRSEAQLWKWMDICLRARLFPLGILLPVPHRPSFPCSQCPASSTCDWLRVSVLPLLTCHHAASVLEERPLAWLSNALTHRTVSMRSLSVSSVQVCILMREVA